MRKLHIDFASLPRTIGVVGSREFPDCRHVERLVRSFRPGTLVVSGGARGVDKAAENTAEARSDVPTPSVHLIDEDLIERIGFKAAALARNTDIVNEVALEFGMVFAFVLWPPKTGGSLDTIRKCKRCDVPYVMFKMTEDGEWLEAELSSHFESGALTWVTRGSGSQ